MNIPKLHTINVLDEQNQQHMDNIEMGITAIINQLDTLSAGLFPQMPGTAHVLSDIEQELVTLRAMAHAVINSTKHKED